MANVIRNSECVAQIGIYAEFLIDSRIRMHVAFVEGDTRDLPACSSHLLNGRLASCVVKVMHGCYGLLDVNCEETLLLQSAELTVAIVAPLLQ